MGAYIDPQYSEKKEAGFVSFLTNLQKKDKATYTAANDYLLTVDRTGKAFSVKRQEGYTVKSPDGEVLATGPTHQGRRLHRHSRPPRGQLWQRFGRAQEGLQQRQAVLLGCHQSEGCDSFRA